MIQDSEKLALLRQMELLQGIDTADVELIAQQMTDEFYTDGDVVVREGDPGDRMFLLLTGTMHVYVERDDKVITYARLRAGQCFGEMALIESAPRSATVQAEASSHCFTLSRQGFLDLLNDHPNISPLGTSMTRCWRQTADLAPVGLCWRDVFPPCQRGNYSGDSELPNKLCCNWASLSMHTATSPGLRKFSLSISFRVSSRPRIGNTLSVG